MFTPKTRLFLLAGTLLPMALALCHLLVGLADVEWRLAMFIPAVATAAITLVLGCTAGGAWPSWLPWTFAGAFIVLGVLGVVADLLLYANGWSLQSLARPLSMSVALMLGSCWATLLGGAARTLQEQKGRFEQRI